MSENSESDFIKHEDDGSRPLKESTFRFGCFVAKFIIVVVLLAWAVVVLFYFIPHYGRKIKPDSTQDILRKSRSLYLQNESIHVKDEWGHYLRLVTDQKAIAEMNPDYHEANFVIYSFGTNGKDEKGGGDDMVVSDK